MFMFESFFKLKQNGTSTRTEIVAGVTTFMTMAYILIVNPQILSQTGMDQGALFTVTAIAAVIGSVAMALLANYPFALAPGLGLNAYFVTVAAQSSWQLALTAVLIEGIIFIVLSVTNIREALFNSIPKSLKFGVSAGIGLFIVQIGFNNSSILTLVKHDVELNSTVITAGLLAIIGVIVIAILLSRKIKGAVLIGILITWVLAMLTEAIGLYVPDNVSFFSTIPSQIIAAPPSISSIAFKFDFANMWSIDFLIIIFAFLFVDLFDTLGTLIGVSSKAGYLDKNGKLPKAKQALLADAIATTAGACLGTSTTTTYIESAAGVADGGRTGLTSLTTAALFLIALPFFPIFSAIPSFATAPALIVVGFFMLETIVKIDFKQVAEYVPALLAVVAMPLTYSISEGIIFGVVSYTVINVCTGQAKKVHPILYVLSILFILKYIIL